MNGANFDSSSFMFERQNWFDDAKCRGLPPDLFVPNLETSGNVYAAKKICNGTKSEQPCPVRSECLEYALSLPSSQTVGCWGGTSQRERAVITAKRNAEKINIQDPIDFNSPLAQLVALVSKVNRGLPD